MGVKGLWEILAHSAQEIEFSQLEGKKLAVDASIWVYQFFKAMCDPETGEPVEGAHIQGFFLRISKLLYFKALPVFVFDGPPPNLKKETLRKRRMIRNKESYDVSVLADQLLKVQLNQHVLNRVKNLKTKGEEPAAGAADVSNEGEHSAVGPAVEPALPAEDASTSSLEDYQTADQRVLANPWLRLRMLNSGNPDHIRLRNLKDSDIPPEIRFFERDPLECIPLTPLQAKDEVARLRLAKDHWEVHNRAECLAHREEATDYSKAQLESYLKLAGINQQLDNVRKEMGKAYLKTVFVPELSTLDLRDLNFPDYQAGAYDLLLEKLQDSVWAKQKKGVKYRKQTPTLAPLVAPSTLRAGQPILKEASGVPTFAFDAHLFREQMGLSPEKVPTVSSDEEEDAIFETVFQQAAIGDMEIPQVEPEIKVAAPPMVENGVDSGDVGDVQPKIEDSSWGKEEDSMEEAQESGTPNDFSEVSAEDSPDLSEAEESGAPNDFSEVSPEDSPVLSEAEDLPEAPESPFGPPPDLQSPVAQVASPAPGVLKAELAPLFSLPDPEDLMTDPLEASYLGSKSSKKKPHDQKRQWDMEAELMELNQVEAHLKEDVVKHRQRAEWVPQEYYEDVKLLLDLMGLPYVEAASEAEAQCAILCQQGLVDAVVSDDVDALVFGAPRVIRHLFSGSGAKCEYYEQSHIQESLGLSQNELILLAIFLGCDYCLGVKNVGIVNAVEIVSNYPSLEALSAFRTWVNQGCGDLLSQPKFVADPQDSVDLQKLKKQKNNLRLTFELEPDFPSPKVYQAFSRPYVHQNLSKFVVHPEFDAYELTRFLVLKTCLARDWITPRLSILENRKLPPREKSKITDYFQPVPKPPDTNLSKRASARMKTGLTRLVNLQKKEEPAQLAKKSEGFKESPKKSAKKSAKKSKAARGRSSKNPQVEP